MAKRKKKTRATTARETLASDKSLLSLGLLREKKEVEVILGKGGKDFTLFACGGEKNRTSREPACGTCVM